MVPLSDAGTWPNISHPKSLTSGCYSIHYAVGDSLRRVTFKGSIAARSAETTLATVTGFAGGLSAEVDAELAPGLVWQQGNSIYFGL